jgi:hypothetical protein
MTMHSRFKQANAEVGGSSPRRPTKNRGLAPFGHKWSWSELVNTANRAQMVAVAPHNPAHISADPQETHRAR